MTLNAGNCRLNGSYRFSVPWEEAVPGDRLWLAQRASDDASAVEQPGRLSPGQKVLACHASAETMSGIAVEVIHRTHARAADKFLVATRRRR
jgi:hypothetical protein